MPTFPGSSLSKPYEDDSEEEEAMPAFERSWMVSREAESLYPATGCWGGTCQFSCARGIGTKGGPTASTHPHEVPIPVVFLTGVVMSYAGCVGLECKISRRRGFTALTTVGSVVCSMGRSKGFVCAAWKTVYPADMITDQNFVCDGDRSRALFDKQKAGTPR